MVQTVTPEHLMGRTWTALGAIPTGLQVLAPMVAAAVSGTEVGAVFAVSGAGLVLLSGFTLARRQAVPLTSTSLESAA